MTNDGQLWRECPATPIKDQLGTTFTHSCWVLWFYKDWKLMGRWRGVHSSMNKWKAETERHVLERAATRWQTNDEGVSLYWTDENSGYLNWCPQTMTAQSYEQACMRSEWPLISHPDASGLPFRISTIQIKSSGHFQQQQICKDTIHIRDKSSRDATFTLESFTYGNTLVCHELRWEWTTMAEWYEK